MVSVSETRHYWVERGDFEKKKKTDPVDRIEVPWLSLTIAESSAPRVQREDALPLTDSQRCRSEMLGKSALIVEML